MIRIELNRTYHRTNPQDELLKTSAFETWGMPAYGDWIMWWGERHLVRRERPDGSQIRTVWEARLPETELWLQLNAPAGCTFKED